MFIHARGSSRRRSRPPGGNRDPGRNTRCRGKIATTAALTRRADTRPPGPPGTSAGLVERPVWAQLLPELPRRRGLVKCQSGCSDGERLVRRGCAHCGVRPGSGGVRRAMSGDTDRVSWGLGGGGTCLPQNRAPCRDVRVPQWVTAQKRAPCRDVRGSPAPAPALALGPG